MGSMPLPNKEPSEKKKRFDSKTYLDGRGYLRFKKGDTLVHRWLAKKHIYDKDRWKYHKRWESYQVHHKDGSKLNNRIENLEIVTRREHEDIHGIKRESLVIYFFKRHPVWTAIIIVLLLLVLISIFLIVKGNKGINENVECSSNLYDCGDFDTQVEAQAVYDYCGSDDIHRLDADDDGVVCESLP